MYHGEIAVSRQEDPRRNQKERTRNAIVEAALAMLRENEPMTVASAAEKAKVSRATAYRYFPTQEALLREIAAQHPAVATVDEVIANLDSEDVEERLLALLDTFNPIVIADETHMRATTQVAYESWLQSRQQPENGSAPPFIRSRRRMGWLDEVLRPLKHLPTKERQRLRAALALTVGIDSIVILKDVCQLDDDDSLEVLRWAAKVLLDAGVNGTDTGDATS